MRKGVLKLKPVPPTGDGKGKYTQKGENPNCWVKVLNLYFYKKLTW